MLNSYTQQIYTASELGSASLPDGATTITAIQFEYRGAAAGGQNFNNWTVYVGNKSSETFSGSNDWTPVSEMTEVFNGIVPIPNASGEWFEVQFATPFEWDGTSNIVIAVDENASGHNSPAGFRTYGGTNSSLRAYKWSSMDPAAAPSTYSGKTRLNNKPIIRFTFADGNDNGGDNGDNGDDNGTSTPIDTTQIEALTVAGFANFKGLTQFDGLVRATSGLVLENLEPELDTNDNFSMLTRGEDGVLRGLDRGTFISNIYLNDCFTHTLRGGLGEGSEGLGELPSWGSRNNEGTNPVLYTGLNCPTRVGIGTSTPQARLDVRGEAYFSGPTKVDSRLNAQRLFIGRTPELEGTSLSVLRTTSTPENLPPLLTLGYVNPSEGAEYHALTFNADGKLVIRNSLEEILQLENDGLLRARRIRIDLEVWSDYVFEEGYELKPLAEVKQFITENGHLPNFPSEKEVIENGVDLGDMNRLLLEKIEELTLYIITQNEDLENLKAELAVLRKIVAK